MFDVNIKILSELKNFIKLVAEDKALLKRFCVADTNFTRTRKLPFEKLVVLIAKLSKKTLSIELEKFFEQAGSSPQCSVSAFTQQRSKLSPLLFYYWNKVLQQSYYHYGESEVKRWNGYRLIAADGSSLTLVNTPALSRYFGGQCNQQTQFVVAKTFYHYDVLNELVILSDIKPYRYGELNMAYDSVDQLEQDMLTIYDRNFSNYKTIALHEWQETPRKFVIRARENQNIIKAFIKSGKDSAIVDIPPTPLAITGLKDSGYRIAKNTHLTVRLVRVDLDKSVEVLITNLWEEEMYPSTVFKDLYFMRWGIETQISVQKNIMQVESFSGLTANAVVQDFYATVLMANLHSLLIKDAQRTIDVTLKHRKYPMKVNKNKSFGKLKMNIVMLFLNSKPLSILKTLHEHFLKDPIPIRKGRSFERARKNRHTNSKFKTFTNFKPAF